MSMNYVLRSTPYGDAFVAYVLKNKPRGRRVEPAVLCWRGGGDPGAAGAVLYEHDREAAGDVRQLHDRPEPGRLLHKDVRQLPGMHTRLSARATEVAHGSLFGCSIIPMAYFETSCCRTWTMLESSGASAVQ